MISVLGVIIDLIHLKKPGGFDVSSFFCDIISPPSSEGELGLQLQPCDKLEDLKRRVRAKEQKKRALSRWGGKTHLQVWMERILTVLLLNKFPLFPRFLG